MKANLKINDILVDNIDLVSKELEKRENLEFELYSEPEGFVGFWIQHTDRNLPCTIMIDLSKNEAMFLGQTLISMANEI